MTIDHLISQYGLFGVFVGAGTEGEAAAVAGGLIAHRHLVPLWQVLAATYAGSLLAGQILFLVGRRFRDMSWVRKRTGAPAYAKIIRALERWPTSFILVYRFIFGVRTLTPLVLSSTKISVLRFSVINAIAAAIWTGVFVGLGYGFGKTVEHLFGHLPSTDHLILIGGLVVAILMIGYGLHRRRQAKRAAP
ncbi:DedA family protein [soil metagenome]